MVTRHSTPSLKISCKSVQQFSCNLADKETNKEIDRKQYPVPDTIGGRVMIITIIKVTKNQTVLKQYHRPIAW